MNHNSRTYVIPIEVYVTSWFFKTHQRLYLMLCTGNLNILTLCNLLIVYISILYLACLLQWFLEYNFRQIIITFAITLNAHTIIIINQVCFLNVNIITYFTTLNAPFISTIIATTSTSVITSLIIRSLCNVDQECDENNIAKLCIIICISYTLFFSVISILKPPLLCTSSLSLSLFCIIRSSMQQQPAQSPYNYIYQLQCISVFWLPEGRTVHLHSQRLNLSLSACLIVQFIMNMVIIIIIIDPYFNNLHCFPCFVFIRV